MEVERFLSVLLCAAVLAVPCAVPVMADDAATAGGFKIGDGVLTAYNGAGGMLLFQRA